MALPGIGGIGGGLPFGGQIGGASPYGGASPFQQQNGQGGQDPMTALLGIVMQLLQLLTSGQGQGQGQGCQQQGQGQCPCCCQGNFGGASPLGQLGGGNNFAGAGQGLNGFLG